MLNETGLSENLMYGKLPYSESELTAVLAGLDGWTDTYLQHFIQFLLIYLLPVFPDQLTLDDVPTHSVVLGKDFKQNLPVL